MAGKGTAGGADTGGYGNRWWTAGGSDGSSWGTAGGGASGGKASEQRWMPTEVVAHGGAKVSGKDGRQKGASVSGKGKHMYDSVKGKASGTFNEINK